ncbi:ATP-binding protein [Nibricoccus sp. IMCC34717]|uniref:ATP-binding protein n=1 Tax=Nibricoccus sp. IMCC34717 TaxID=3034021 RepID=UPI00385025DB
MPFIEKLFSSFTQVPPRGGIEAKVEGELLRVAYQAARLGVVINVVVPLVVAAVLWGHAESWLIISWVLSIASLSIGRLVLHRRFLEKSRGLDELPTWTQAFRMGALATALLWGVASWKFLEVDNAVLRSFVIFIVTGLSAGASRSLAPIPFCFTPYALLALAPIIARYSLTPVDGGWALALMTVVYVVFLSVSARSQRAELGRMYRTLIENEALLADLREAKLRAEEANKAKGDFLSSISHEIHTPMHGVLGMLQLLEQSELSADQRVQVDVAMGSANALHALLKDVLDFSQIEGGRLEIARAPFALQEVVREMSAFLTAGVEAKGGARIECAVPSTDKLPLYVIGDAVRLKQVLGNLLSNAVKFTENGRIEFSTTVVVSQPELTVVRFGVRDSGPGMSEELLARAFEKFTMGNASMTRRHGGIGLGLAIAQQLVWRMGGEIRVQSRPGEGSHFWFEVPFPRAPMGQEETALFHPSLPHELLEGKVLVVEDDRASRQVVEMMLRRWSLTVRTVETGEEAIREIQEWQPSVVLMDVRLPGIDGLSATRKIREMALRVAIVALTANTSPQDRTDCLEAGMDGFLTKPVQAPDLHRCLKRWLRSGK